MAPIATISAISSEAGLSTSNLVVTTALGVADFCVESDTAEQARMLLMRLVAEATGPPDDSVDTSSTERPSNSVDELINLKWMVDADAADSLDSLQVSARMPGL